MDNLQNNRFASYHEELASTLVVPSFDLPSGARLLLDVIDEQTEDAIIRDIITGNRWKMLKSGRAVQEYGYAYHFKEDCRANSMDKVPSFVMTFVGIVAAKLGRNVNQIIVNRYLPGEGIGNHQDKDVPCDWFASLSLSSDIVIKFNPLNTSKSKYNLLLPRRSLLFAEGDAFFKYKHGISYKKKEHDGTERGTRISITGRYLSEKLLDT